MARSHRVEGALVRATLAMTTALLPASTTSWPLSLARVLARRHLQRHTDGFVIDGLDGARAALARGPVLFCANHLSVHDAYAMVVADEALGGGSRALMDEAQLERLPFFRALGALPLSLTAPRRALAQLADAATWLSAPRRALWIFPQGRHVPSWRRPLGFRRGFVRLLRGAPTAVVVPVSLVLVFRDATHPRLSLRFGAALDNDVAADDVEAAVAAGIDALDAATDAPTWVAGRVTNAGEGAAARWLARLVRLLS